MVSVPVPYLMSGRESSCRRASFRRSGTTRRAGVVVRQAELQHGRLREVAGDVVEAPYAAPDGEIASTSTSGLYDICDTRTLGRPKPNGRHPERLPLASLSATAIWLCALAVPVRPPTSSASTPLLLMNSTEVGRMMLAGRFGVNLCRRVAPWFCVPQRSKLSAT